MTAVATTPPSLYPLESIQSSLVGHIDVAPLVSLIHAYTSQTDKDAELVAMATALVAHETFPSIARDLGIKPTVDWFLSLPRISVDLKDAFDKIKSYAPSATDNQFMTRLEFNQAETVVASATAQKTKAWASCWLTESPVGIIVEGRGWISSILVCLISSSGFKMFSSPATTTRWPYISHQQNLSAGWVISNISGWLGIDQRSTAFPPSPESFPLITD